MVILADSIHLHHLECPDRIQLSEGSAQPQGDLCGQPGVGGFCRTVDTKARMML